jgi:hypothetical protein
MHYLLDEAPDGSSQVYIFSDKEMSDRFSKEQLANLADGKRIIHHWYQSVNHKIINMVIASKS